MLYILDIDLRGWGIYHCKLQVQRVCQVQLPDTGLIRPRSPNAFSIWRMHTSAARFWLYLFVYAWDVWPITYRSHILFLTLPMSIFTYHPNHKLYQYFQGNTTAIARVGNNGVADEGYSFPLQECQGDCDNNGGKIELSFLFYPLVYPLVHNHDHLVGYYHD